MKNDDGIKLKKLVQLTKDFIDFADELKKNGTITEEQYVELVKNKIEFINNVSKTG